MRTRPRPHAAATTFGLLYLFIAILLVLHAYGYSLGSVGVSIIIPCVMIALGILGIFLSKPSSPTASREEQKNDDSAQ